MVAVLLPLFFPVVVMFTVDDCVALKAVAAPAELAKVTLAVIVAFCPWPDTVHDQVVPIVPVQVGVTEVEPIFTFVQIMPADAVTPKDCWTWGAALYCELPAWL